MLIITHFTEGWASLFLLQLGQPSCYEIWQRLTFQLRAYKHYKLPLTPSGCLDEGFTLQDNALPLYFIGM